MASYFGNSSPTAVGTLISTLDLSSEQLTLMQRIIDATLTDAFYGILLGLDGSAAIGTKQQGYTIHDEAGALISKAGDGELESHAYAVFQEDPA